MPIEYPILRPLVVNLACSVALAGIALSASACGDMWSSRATSSRSPAPEIPAAAPLAEEDKANEGMLRFLESRVKNDPEDFVANNKLAAFYLQRARETGGLTYLDLATRAGWTAAYACATLNQATVETFDNRSHR